MAGCESAPLGYLVGGAPRLARTAAAIGERVGFGAVIRFTRRAGGRTVDLPVRYRGGEPGGQQSRRRPNLCAQIPQRRASGVLNRGSGVDRKIGPIARDRRRLP